MKYVRFLIFIPLLSACSFFGGTIPVDHFYRLPAPTPSIIATAVEITAVRTDGLYNERALLFVNAERPLELQRYTYHFWALTPAKMLQSYLQACLIQSDAAQQPDNNKSRIQLSPIVESFERVLANGQALAVVKLRINQRDYASSVAADALDMHATVVAYGQAMQKICAAIAHDM